MVMITSMVKLSKLLHWHNHMILEYTPILCAKKGCFDVAASVSAYDLLIELSTDCLANLKCVANRLIAMHHSCRLMNSKEWELKFNIQCNNQ
uniref:Uncharacterized protein n=1 Tax=Amphimedon queenslandica TaxID=400682 RepID=A0A1X7SPC0_AMPQE